MRVSVDADSRTTTIAEAAKTAATLTAHVPLTAPWQEVSGRSDAAAKTGANNLPARQTIERARPLVAEIHNRDLVTFEFDLRPRALFV